MCCPDEIASFPWEEEVVDAERSSLNVNVSSLSQLAEEGQESQANQECSLQAIEEAQEVLVELCLFQYHPAT